MLRFSNIPVLHRVCGCPAALPRPHCVIALCVVPELRKVYSEDRPVSGTPAHKCRLSNLQCSVSVSIVSPGAHPKGDAALQPLQIGMFKKTDFCRHDLSSSSEIG